MKLGQFINKYIKSYGSLTYYHPPIIIWPRRSIVKLIERVIAQIDEETYQKIRNTTAYRQ